MNFYTETEHKAWRQSLKVGDKITIARNLRITVFVVDRKTATRIIVRDSQNNLRTFLTDSGKEVGASAFLHFYDAEQIAAVRAEIKDALNRQSIRDIGKAFSTGAGLANLSEEQAATLAAELKQLYAKYHS